jgi:VIT1/CCC1 family predicted Fe2+/Mn2+ transporter
MERFLPEFVYGATDGTVTTFAIVAGAIGANLSRTAVLAIGIASVLADGYSMGVSSYLSESTRHDQTGESLAASKGHTPLASGIATFLSFVAIGTLPLIPFLTTSRITSSVVYISLVVALASFAGIGYLRGIVTKRKYPLITSGESLLIGGSTAVIAYAIGKIVGH